MSLSRSLRRSLWLLLLAVLFTVLSVAAGNPAAWPVFVAAVFAIGGLVVGLWYYGDFTSSEVLAGAVVFRLLLLWLPPGLSDDAYRYVWDGLLQLEGINPYRYAPQDPALAPFQDEAIYEELNSASFYSVYPPVSQLVFAFGGLWYGYGWEASYYVIKLIFALSEVAALFLLARMVEARTLMLYAWHPLVVVETAGQAHTEGAVVLFLVLTLYLARRGRDGAASAALACAGWVKLYPFVLLPFLWRRFGWRSVGATAAAAVLLALPYAAAEAPGHLLASLDLYVRYFEFNAGFYYGLKSLFRFVTGTDWSKMLGPALRGLFLAYLLGLYYLDGRRAWPLRRLFVLAIGGFLLLSTTVHPWYLLGILPLVVLAEPPPWHWYWVALCSMGTYLLYVGGPYWTFVHVGWTGFLLLGLWRYRDGLLQAIQQRRAVGKFRWIRSFLPVERPLRMLDLGAGEGYVGAAAARALGAEVVLADVVDLNRTDLPLVRYDGRYLPFPDDTFDAVILYFVLHHCRDPEAVLREALRVTRGRVLVVESVYGGHWDRRLLTFLDRRANRWRSGGRMNAQEAHLHFRTAAGWRALFEREGAAVLAQERRGRFLHKQALFVLQSTRG